VNVAVVDLGLGNLGSVLQALRRAGGDPQLVTDPSSVARAPRVILPGVAAFGLGMERVAPFQEALRTALGRRAPVLGICLGMQLLFDSSVEHEGAAGLGLLAGTVTRLESPGLKIPHIGWNTVSFARPSILTEGLGDAAAFYHVHTFASRPADEADVVGLGEYGERFVSIVERGNVMGVQFHPEKSSLDGLALLRNFVGVRVHA
jgi:imidazole glycerol-phosphate synthase subunit HisH